MPAEAMVNQVIEDFGRIDILINAAAVTPRTPLLEMDEWDWRRTLDVNLSAPFFTMQLVGRLMRRQGGGVMVNIISFESPAADQCASFASKAGLAALTQVAARELAPYGIRLNAVCPGVVEAGLAPAFQRTPVSDPFAGRAASAVDWVLYLCSPAASHLTGQVAAGSAITLSGGMNTPGVD
jgi:NAD(P)-dependent dehydrogenase (short-subunit alcohol dehydrogenase family)